MGQHKVAKAIKEKHVIKFQKFDSPKSQKLTLIINGLRSLPRPYGMVLDQNIEWHRLQEIFCGRAPLCLSIFSRPRISFHTYFNASSDESAVH